MSIVNDIELNEEKHYLGKLCKWGHEYRDTGKSIRYKIAQDCIGCNRERKCLKAKIEAQRLIQPNILIDDFDFSSGLYDLGHLCPTRHNYKGLDQSVRLLSNNHCFHCRQDYYVKTIDYQRAKARAYREANREKVLAKLRAYFLRPDIAVKKKAYQKEYYAKHKEFLNAKNREYSKNNRIKINITQTKWRKSLAGAASHRASRRRREERMKAAKLVPYNGHQIAERYELFNCACAYCGTTEQLTDDHVIAIASGGYDRPENIVPACKSCNSKKQNFLVFTWYKKQPFFDIERLLFVFESLGSHEQIVLVKELRLKEGLRLNSFVVAN